MFLAGFAVGSWSFIQLEVDKRKLTSKRVCEAIFLRLLLEGRGSCYECEISSFFMFPAWEKIPIRLPHSPEKQTKLLLSDVHASFTVSAFRVNYTEWIEIQFAHYEWNQACSLYFRHSSGLTFRHTAGFAAFFPLSFVYPFPHSFCLSFSVALFAFHLSFNGKSFFWNFKVSEQLECVWCQFFFSILR